MIRSIFIFCIASVMSISGARSQSLDELVSIAIENNPGLKADYLEFEAALKQVAQVNALPDPRLSFGIFALPVETRLGPQRAKIGLSQMFPWFGTLKARGDVAAGMAEVKHQQFIESQLLLAQKVKHAYYPLAELDRTLVIYREHLKILDTYRQLALTKLENGQSDMVDVIRVDMKIAKVANDTAVLGQQRPALLATLNALVNRDLGTPVRASLPNIDLDVLNSANTDSLPVSQRIRILEAKQDMLDAKALLAYKMGLPKIGVGLDYVVVGKRQDMNPEHNGRDILMPMASVSLPLKRSKYTAMADQIELEKQALALDQTNVTHSIAASYQIAATQARQAELSTTLYQQQLQSSSQAVELLTQQYSTSGTNFEEVLRMQQEQLNYEIGLARVTTKFWMNMARIDYLISNTN